MLIVPGGVVFDVILGESNGEGRGDVLGDVLIFVDEGSGNNSSSFTPTGVCRSGEGTGDGEGLASSSGNAEGEDGSESREEER